MPTTLALVATTLGSGVLLDVGPRRSRNGVRFGAPAGGDIEGGIGARLASREYEISVWSATVAASLLVWFTLAHGMWFLAVVSPLLQGTVAAVAWLAASRNIARGIEPAGTANPLASDGSGCLSRLTLAVALSVMELPVGLFFLASCYGVILRNALEYGASGVFRIGSALPVFVLITAAGFLRKYSWQAPTCAPGGQRTQAAASSRTFFTAAGLIICVLVSLGIAAVRPIAFSGRVPARALVISLAEVATLALGCVLMLLKLVSDVRFAARFWPVGDLRSESTWGAGGQPRAECLSRSALCVTGGWRLLIPGALRIAAVVLAIAFLAKEACGV
jgi:hypothetical protein